MFSYKHDTWTQSKAFLIACFKIIWCFFLAKRFRKMINLSYGLADFKTVCVAGVRHTNSINPWSMTINSKFKRLMQREFRTILPHTERWHDNNYKLTTLDWSSYDCGSVATSTSLVSLITGSSSVVLSIGTGSWSILLFSGLFSVHTEWATIC